MSSAIWEANCLILTRVNGKRNVRTMRIVEAVTAITTVPTGFAAVPPDGPAIPVAPTQCRLPHAI